MVPCGLGGLGMRYASRMRRLATRTFFGDVEARLKAGGGLVNFAYGEPDQPTHQPVKLATHLALAQERTKYAPTMGLGELRRAIAEHVARTRRIKVDEDEVCVLPGANPAFLLGLLALADEGDEVICPNPGYPVYRSATTFVGATPVPLPLRPEIGYAFDPAELETLVTPRTRVIIVNSPHNPTGSCLDPEHLAALAETAVRHDLWVLSDEVYAAFTYEGPFASVATCPGMNERTLVVDSFSKTFAMTGWRLGWAVGPRPLASFLGGLVALSDSCVNTFVQCGGVEALRDYDRQAARMREIYRRRRDATVAGLERIAGFACPKPKGSFYVFPEVTGACARLGLASAADLERLLVQGAGVAILARERFGPRNPGERGEFIRLSYTLPLADIDEGLLRIRRTVEGRGAAR